MVTGLVGSRALNNVTAEAAMHSLTCIFCKIVQKEAPSTVVRENEQIIVIKNISPQAPIHYLIMPKKHIDSLATINDSDSTLGWEMIKMARDLGADVPGGAFNLISNTGKAAGQSVFHVHFHFLAGKNLYEHGFSL